MRRRVVFLRRNWVGGLATVPHGLVDNSKLHVMDRDVAHSLDDIPILLDLPLVESNECRHPDQSVPRFLCNLRPQTGPRKLFESAG